MTQNSFTLPSFAKINLLLRILGKRQDGFHELCTVFQTVSLFDEITFVESDRLSLECDAENIPTDDSNLILKAANVLQKEFGVEKGAKIRLKKNIPEQGGLGGGSSNAAVALLGLAMLWKLRIEPGKLVETGAKLGSDVPFFFYGGTGSGTGRGTEITPLQEFTENYLLIVKPPAKVSTAEAFARLNAPNLTNETSKSILEICQKKAERLVERQINISNDFEKSVFEFAPEIKRVKDTLIDAGAKQAILSGSGASVFAIFDNEETRQATLKALEKEQAWRKFAVATVSSEEYRSAFKKNAKGCFRLVSEKFCIGA